MSERKSSGSDLSDGQFAVIETLIPAPKSGGRPPKYKRREIVNGIMYVLRSGCAWRMMPHDLPTWRITSGKKINGRKRHILVDVLGLILSVVVHPANIQDRDGAKLVLEKITHAFSRLRLIWADGGYGGRLIEWVFKLRLRGKVTLENVKRTDDIRGFKVLPKRWIVERTFGWLGRWRRLSKDYEYLTNTSETMIRIAMIGLMTRRLSAKKNN